MKKIVKSILIALIVSTLLTIMFNIDYIISDRGERYFMSNLIMSWMYISIIVIILFFVGWTINEVLRKVNEKVNEKEKEL